MRVCIAPLVHARDVKTLRDLVCKCALSGVTLCGTVTDALSKKLFLIITLAVQQPAGRVRPTLRPLM
jgi:hypothetical protein